MRKCYIFAMAALLCCTSAVLPVQAASVQAEADAPAAAEWIGTGTETKNITVYDAANNGSFRMSGRIYTQGIVFTGASNDMENNAVSTVTYDVSAFSTISFTVGHVDNTVLNSGTLTVSKDGQEADSVFLSYNITAREYTLDVSDAQSVTFTVTVNGKSQFGFGSISADGSEPEKPSAAPEYDAPEKLMNTGYNMLNTAVYTAADKSQSFKMNGRTYYQGLVFSGGASYNETNASLFTVNTENVSRLRFTAGHIDNAARKNATVKIYRDNVHDEAEDIVLTPDMALKEYELDVSDTKCLLLWIDRGGDSVYAFGDISVNEKECGLKSAAPVYASPEKMLNASFNSENITVCSATDQSQSFKMNGRTYYQGIQFNGGMPYYDPNTSRISFNTENVSRLSFTAGHLDNTALKDATLYIYRDNVKSDEETIGLSASMPLKDYVIDVTDTGVLTLVMERKTKSDSSVSISGYGFANVSFDGRQAELECKIPKYTDTAQLLKAGFNTQKAAVYSGDDTSRTFTVGSETYSQGIVFGGGNFYTPQTENRISFNVENTGAVTMKLGCVQSTDGKEDSVMRVMLDNQEIRQIPLKKDMPVRDYTFNTAGSAVLELVVPVSYTDSYAAADIRLSDTPVILRGDVNGNGEVGVDDAQIALRAYTERISGKPLPLNKAQTEAADVDDSGIISIEDVQLILKYYTENTVAGKKVSWEALIQ